MVLERFSSRRLEHRRIAGRIQYALPAIEKPSLENRPRGCAILSPWCDVPCEYTHDWDAYSSKGCTLPDGEWNANNTLTRKHRLISIWNYVHTRNYGNTGDEPVPSPGGPIYIYIIHHPSPGLPPLLVSPSSAASENKTPLAFLDSWHRLTADAMCSCHIPVPGKTLTTYLV